MDGSSISAGKWRGVSYHAPTPELEGYWRHFQSDTRRERLTAEESATYEDANNELLAGSPTQINFGGGLTLCLGKPSNWYHSVGMHVLDAAGHDMAVAVCKVWDALGCASDLYARTADRAAPSDDLPALEAR